MYPGTWGPALRGRSPSAGATGFIDHAFARLRAKLITGGIPTNVPLHVSESGYPTGPGRTEAMQSESLTASIMALHAARRTYDITNYTWFDLRDANSSTDSFQTHYGILRDDYSPKAAFAVYKSLVAKLSCG